MPIKRATHRKRILYVQYTNPAIYPPLEHSSRILADKGCQVRFLGIAAAPELYFPPHPRVEVLRLREVPPGARQKLNYVHFLMWCLWHALIWRPDWVYVSDIFAAPAGVLMQLATRRRVLYHEHDWPATGGASAMVRVCLAARRRLARRAAVRVVPNDERGRWISEEVSDGAPTRTVWNCPRLEEVGCARGPFSSPLRLLYQGSINRHRLPLTLLRGIALARGRTELVVVGYETSGSRGYVAEFLEEARRARVAGQVRVVEAVSRFDLRRFRVGCHLGVAFIPHAGQVDRNFSAMVGATNKVFDYMAGVMCPLVSDSPEWLVAFAEPGYALACNPADAESIARLLDWCSSHARECREIGERGRQRLMQEWNYEAQFAPIAREICAA